MNLSRFTNVPVMLMMKSGNLMNRIDTVIHNFSVDNDSVLIAHSCGEITAFHATVLELPDFVSISESDKWNLSIFLR